MKIPVRIDILDNLFQGAYMVPEPIALTRIERKWLDGLVERGWCQVSNNWYTRTTECTKAEIEALQDFFGGLDLLQISRVTFPDGRTADIAKMAASHMVFIENMKVDSYAAWAYINNLKQLAQVLGHQNNKQ